MHNFFFIVEHLFLHNINDVSIWQSWLDVSCSQMSCVLITAPLLHSSLMHPTLRLVRNTVLWICLIALLRQATRNPKGMWQVYAYIAVPFFFRTSTWAMLLLLHMLMLDSGSHTCTLQLWMSQQLSILVYTTVCSRTQRMIQPRHEYPLMVFSSEIWFTSATGIQQK